MFHQLFWFGKIFLLKGPAAELFLPALAVWKLAPPTGHALS
jgi:hypothetical protein